MLTEDKIQSSFMLSDKEIESVICNACMEIEFVPSVVLNVLSPA